MRIKRLLESHWFTKCWWKYLLEKPDWYSKKYTTWWVRFRCRRNGHPEGVWWYNASGSEPDMRCKNCGDDLS